jgi:hypothetical protein
LARKWIKRAIGKDRGSLHEWAAEHNFLHNGIIELGKALRYTKEKGNLHRERQIYLARTLKRLRKKRK